MESSDDWLHKAEGKRQVAQVMKESRSHASEAIDACGMGCEFAFKALIMRKTRMNRWPDRADKPEYHVHDLEKLFRLAGLTRADIPDKLRSSVRTAFTWRVEHRYDRDRPPRKQARQMYEAVFGEEGVIAWLKTL